MNLDKIVAENFAYVTVVMQEYALTWADGKWSISKRYFRSVELKWRAMTLESTGIQRMKTISGALLYE